MNKSVNFSYNNQKYEINVSLYSNAVMIFICYNAKLANMYELNIDLEEEQEKNAYNDLIGEENEVKDIDIAECILGKRGNERFNFMANFIISYIFIFTYIIYCIKPSSAHGIVCMVRLFHKIRIFLKFHIILQ